MENYNKHIRTNNRSKTIYRKEPNILSSFERPNKKESSVHIHENAFNNNKKNARLSSRYATRYLTKKKTYKYVSIVQMKFCSCFMNKQKKQKNFPVILETISKGNRLSKY